MSNTIISVVIFVIGLIMSTIIIYIVTRLFGDKKGIKPALVAAYIWSNNLQYSRFYSWEWLFGSNSWWDCVVIDSKSFI